MIVATWIVAVAIAVGFLLLLATILMFFAWKGMELENRELRARLHIVQIDLHGLTGRRPKADPLSLRDGSQA